LGIRLSERACYLGEWKAKPPMGCGPAAGVSDMAAALSLVWRALGLWLFLWLLCGLLLNWIQHGVLYVA
jgi:adenosylcobinamide-phosphate synthase